MITKASELLELFIEEEKRKLGDVEMPHMPTLGSAYEEITKKGIEQDYAIPKSLDLRVVSGFVSADGEMLPEQIDCMLVHGNGEKYGLTDQYIYDIDNVLCIFEVKKTLGKKDYVDAFEHLGKIRRKFSEHFEKKLKDGNYEPNIDAASRHFSQITGKAAPVRYLDLHALPKCEAILFYSLVQEALAPTSIIHGYGGYKTENGLRTAFIDILEEKRKQGGEGIGVPSLPSLVTSNNFCLIKGNGVPFIAVRSQNEWVSIFSTRHNAAKIILELVWSKISIYFDAKMPWNDGLHVENIHPLLIAKFVESGDQAGWMYEAVELKEKRLVRNDDNQWSPEAIGNAELSAINIMAMRGGYLPLDDGLDTHLQKEHGVSLEETVENLLMTRMFMKDEDYLRPIHAVTHVITTEDGGGFVSSERDRLDLWCEKSGIKPSYMNLIFIE